jgi:hypothetical protein
MLFSLPFQDIKITDVQELLADGGYPESEQVEYKEFVPGREVPDNWHRDQSKGIADYGRDKMLAEIVAFANSHGGHLIVGIKESDDKPKRAIGITPVPACADLADRLRQAAFASIEPRLANLQARGVPSEAADGSGVVVVRVPRSQAAPHRVMGRSSEVTRHSYVRRGDSTETMTMTEIQDLTFNTARGLDAVDAALNSLHNDFVGKLQNSFNGLPTLSRIGIMCAAVPIQLLVLRRADIEVAAPTIRRHFMGHFREGSAQEFQVPAHGYNTRPILRGTQIDNVTSTSIYQHFLRVDGSQRAFVISSGHYDKIRLLKPATIFDTWILGLVASVLDQCAELAKRAENPGAEYAIDVAIYAASHFMVNLNNSTYLIASGDLAIRLPRYSYFADSDPARVLNEVLGDVLNDQGHHHLNELVKLE